RGAASRRDGASCGPRRDRVSLTTVRDRSAAVREVHVEDERVFSILPTESERAFVVGLDADVTLKHRIPVSEPQQLDDSTDHGAIEGEQDFVLSKVMAIDGAAIASSHDGIVVILAGQKADVVDLRNASREELD